VDHPITSKQRETLELLQWFAAERGYQPSLRGLADLLGLRSVSSVHARLDGLARAGMVRRRPGRPRAVEVADVGTTEQG
jgi:repressor LexA